MGNMRQCQTKSTENGCYNSGLTSHTGVNINSMLERIVRTIEECFHSKSTQMVAMRDSRQEGSRHHIA